MKLLFIHNTIPEYRIEFMKKLSKLIDTEFLITNKSLHKKVYGIKVVTSLDELKIDYLPEKKRFVLIKKKIIDSDCDAIVLPPADNVPQYLNGVWALLWGKKNNKKIIYWTEKWEAEIHNQPLKKKIKNRIHRVMIGSLAKKSNICIAAGSKSKEYFHKIGVTDSKIRIAYDSSISPRTVMKFDLREKYNIPSKAKIVLYFGRLIERKGCELLIKAFKQITRDVEEPYLLICGDGEYLSQCKSLVNRLNLYNVVFAGKIDPEVREVYYSQANVFVLPSYSLDGVIEAWGLTVNEAMEFGLPVIATTAVGAAYDLVNEKNGYMVEERNIKQLGDAIAKVIKNENKIPYKQNCLYTAEKYSVDQMAKSFTDAVNDCK